MNLSLVQASEIVVPDRIRKADSPEVLDHIESLRASIRRFGGHPHGLLQPILLDEHNVLQAGWCRYTACMAEGWATIPCYNRSNLHVDELREIELEENFRRLNFTWQEEVAAVVDIHKRHRISALRAGNDWTQQMTGDLLGGYSDSYVSNCLRVFPKLTDDKYAKCTGLTDAVRLWYQEKEDAGVAELARRTVLNPATAPKFDLEIEVLDTSCVACGGTGRNSKGDLCTPCLNANRIRINRVASTAATPQIHQSKLPTQVPEGFRCLLCNGWGASDAGVMCWPCNGTGSKTGRYYRPDNLAEGESNVYEHTTPSVGLPADVNDPNPMDFLTLTAPADVHVEPIPLSQSLFCGDCVDVLASWPADCVDHIITDPPYAIDVDMMQQASQALMDVSRISDTHQVDDNLALYERMLPSFYRVLRDGGFMILWCDVMRWQRLYDLAESTGFGIQRWPLIWAKTSPCKNQMAHCNFTKDYEMAIVCRKGHARLPAPVNTSRITCPNDALKASNPFAKPFDAWRFLIESVSVPGQTLLEPFAGEGSAVLSGLKLNRRVLAIEKDPTHYNYLLNEVKTYWSSVFPNVTFV
jgi:DNA modification methylase